MTRKLARAVALALIGLLAGCSGSDPGTGNPIGPTGHDDSDGDGIGDTDEGRFMAGGAVDTDGDGIPDFLDSDSDDDGIDDVHEAGDMDVTTPPSDLDGDTIADFKDTDSDDNGIDDGVEGFEDSDSDTIIDAADPDNDGDLLDDVVELGGLDVPPDSDGDGIPDYEDLDSDGDGIADRHERATDTDLDLIPDYLDLDTDNDTIPDTTEAGDTDVNSPPRDTDGDFVHDFRDVDSDNDGLPDMWEHPRGMDPFSADTDMDGTTDLIEVGADTDPLDSSDNPRSRGNFVFVMYYNDPEDPTTVARDPDPTSDHLVFSTDLQMADVFFTLDSSGSMSGEITNLRTSLRTTVVPGVLAEIPNVWFGVGRFEDCSSYCANNMAVIETMTDDVPALEASLGTMTNTCGGNEPYTQNLYALATGDVAPFSGWGGVHPTSWTCPGATDYGWPCFRDGSIPIIVQFGDEPFDEGIGYCSPSKNHDASIAALNGISAKYIGVNSGSTYGSREDMIIVATGTGSVDTSGSPLVFDIPSDGSGLGTQVVTAIEILANQVPIEVTTQLVDDPGDLVNTVEEFVDHIVPSVVGGYADPADPTVICVSGLEVGDLYAPLDGRPDSFPSILPGTIVCFDIHVKQNWTVPSSTGPQTYECDINVIGDGITILDTRKVYFLVPPDIDDVLPG